MDQHLNNNQNEFLWTLLANPASDSRLHAYNLQRLVDDFPQSGILQALLAQASDDKNLKQASVYFNAKLLFKLINTPTAFAAVPDEKIIKLNSIRSNGYHQNEEAVPVDESLTAPKDQPIDIDPHGSNTYFSEYSAVETDPETPLVAPDNPPAGGPEAEFQLSDDQQVTVDTTEIANLAAEGYSNDISTAAQVNHGNAERILDQDEAVVDLIAGEDAVVNDEMQATANIEGETFDEVIDTEDISTDDAANQPPIAGQVESEVPAAETSKETPGDKYPMPTLNDEADKLIVGNIASTDFFMFDRAFGENREAGKNLPATTANDTADIENNARFSEGKQHQDLSKYNDEKMPYTFMWWLDKTRKEHAGINQPYAMPGTTNSIVKGKNVTDELQQQYFENIFHITSVDELDKHTMPKVFAFGMKRKEQVIIERFIKEEPQIKPQSGDKLDNENKAKKSSEDRDELVTETLAAIYVDQMLYHKAIASYKKLMLKYPEKSRYFAGKIEQLEKKTN